MYQIPISLCVICFYKNNSTLPSEHHSFLEPLIQPYRCFIYEIKAKNISFSLKINWKLNLNDSLTENEWIWHHLFVLHSFTRIIINLYLTITLFTYNNLTVCHININVNCFSLYVSSLVVLCPLFIIINTNRQIFRVNNKN